MNERENVKTAIHNVLDQAGVIKLDETQYGFKSGITVTIARGVAEKDKKELSSTMIVSSRKEVDVIDARYVEKSYYGFNIDWTDNKLYVRTEDEDTVVDLDSGELYFEEQK